MTRPSNTWQAVSLTLMDFSEFVHKGKYSIYIGSPDDGKSYLLLPTVSWIDYIHNQVIEYCKQNDLPVPPISHRSPGQLDFFIEKLKGKRLPDDRYRTVLKIAEDIVFEIACRHPFMDGNKRTALLCCNVFLNMNMLQYVQIEPKYKSFTVELDQSKAIKKAKEIEIIAEWNEAEVKPGLKEFLVSNGIIVKREVTEDHIRQFIRKFIVENFVSGKTSSQ